MPSYDVPPKPHTKKTRVILFCKIYKGFCYHSWARTKYSSTMECTHFVDGRQRGGSDRAFQCTIDLGKLVAGDLWLVTWWGQARMVWVQSLTIKSRCVPFQFRYKCLTFQCCPRLKIQRPLSFIAWKKYIYRGSWLISYFLCTCA